MAFVVDVNLQLGNLVFCFGDYEEVVRWEDLEVFALVVGFVLGDGSLNIVQVKKR